LKQDNDVLTWEGLKDDPQSSDEYAKINILNRCFDEFQNPLPWASCPTTMGPNDTIIIVPECEKSSETAYFWYREALDISPSIEETGGLKWWMVICLAVAWIVVYFIIQRGVQSAGKVSILSCNIGSFYLFEHNLAANQSVESSW